MDDDEVVNLLVRSVAVLAASQGGAWSASQIVTRAQRIEEYILGEN